MFVLVLFRFSHCQIFTRELVWYTWAALGQAEFISKPGLRARDLVLVDLVLGRFNYRNDGSL